VGTPDARGLAEQERADAEGGGGAVLAAINSRGAGRRKWSRRAASAN